MTPSWCWSTPARHLILAGFRARSSSLCLNSCQVAGIGSQRRVKASAAEQCDKAGAMRAILRWRTFLVAAGLMLAPSVTRAQDASQPATANSPAPDTVGPRELQNFSLPGTPTKPADQEASPPTSAGTPVHANVAPTDTVTEAPGRVRKEAETRQAAKTAPPPPSVAPPASVSHGSAAPPSVSAAAVAPPPPPVSSAPALSVPAAGPVPTLASESERKPSILPWLMRSER